MFIRGKAVYKNWNESNQIQTEGLENFQNLCVFTLAVD